jgi:RHS repeat-associated protein
MLQVPHIPNGRIQRVRIKFFLLTCFVFASAMTTSPAGVPCILHKNASCTVGLAYDGVALDTVIIHVAPGVPSARYSGGLRGVNSAGLSQNYEMVVVNVAADGSWTGGYSGVGVNYASGINGWSFYGVNGDGHTPVTVTGDLPFLAGLSCDGHTSGDVRHGTIEITIGVPSSQIPSPEYVKSCDKKAGGDQCSTCFGMAHYSAHAMLASLNIEDTPLRHLPPRGPAVNFTVTYNQKETQQPSIFNYSNLGPKWTFNWLSYVIDNPTQQLPTTAVYMAGGGVETYSFDFGTQAFGADAQSHAVLVRTGSSSYEKDFPDGSKQIFNATDGATSYPRKIFVTQMVDPAGNSVSIGYDSSLRITTITDALGQVTTVSYEFGSDPLKITKVTDPFGRFATFQYENGNLKTITDPVGIQSQFTYQSGTDSVASLTTPYGTSTFVSGGSGTNRWIEMTDPLGGKERVEYRDNAPGIGPTDPANAVPGGFTNAGLDITNTFYWDKKATELYPPVNGVYDYTKARITHWLENSDGSTSGIISSEKAPLENRVWYQYTGQPVYFHAGPSANPSQIARVLDDGTTQLFRYEYNSIGNRTKATDPAGRVMSYIYDSNQIDLLETRQTTGTNNELLRKVTYNGLREPLTDTDAAGQVTTSTYNAQGQILTRNNAKNETTTYGYGNGTPGHPLGYLDSITTPQFNGVSAQRRFIYDSAFFGPNAPKRIACIIDEPDHYVVEYRYDDLDRVKSIGYPDGTQQTFDYTDPARGMTLDLTQSQDRRGRLTTRHYDANRHLDSVTDPLNRTTLYGWCTCGSLESITDARVKKTTFVRDLQSRLISRQFQDRSFISYFYENTTSRLKAMTDFLSQKTNYFYNVDDTLRQTTYTDMSGNPLNPPTPSVSFGYDPNYNRVATMTDGTGTTNYSHFPVGTPPSLGANQLETVDGPFNNDTITYSYDELGRTVGQSINGVASNVSYDSLGRLATSDNALGHFSRAYVGVTPRLQTLTYPNGQTANYSYFDNSHDRKLQTLQNLTNVGTNLSTFDYTYDAEGQILNWAKHLGTTAPALTGAYGYDLADQLKSATTATIAPPGNYSYDYDLGGNRMTDQLPPGAHTFNDVNESQDPGYTYDANGNLISDGVKDYFWDAANRLIAVQTKASPPSGLTNFITVTASPTPPPVPTPPSDFAPLSAPTASPGPIPQAPAVPVLRSEFSYDGLGRRVRIVEKQASHQAVTSGVPPTPVWITVSDRHYLWSGNTLAEERDSSGAESTKRFFAEGEQLTDPARLYFSRDHLGNVREVTDATGAVHAQYDYDPFGVRTKLSGDLDADFGFTGHYHHLPSGLNLSLYRAYSPALGRWLSRDPVGERAGVNLYAYVGNNPSNAIDPLGLIDILIAIAPRYFTPDQLADYNRRNPNDLLTRETNNEVNVQLAAGVRNAIEDFLKTNPKSEDDRVDIVEPESKDALFGNCKKYDKVLMLAHGNDTPGQPYTIAIGLDRVQVRDLPANCTPFGCQPGRLREAPDVVADLLSTLRKVLGR